MKQIDRKLLFHLVDIVWGDAFEDESVPSTAHARTLIVKAIERRRSDKYSNKKLNRATSSSKRPLKISDKMYEIGTAWLKKTKFKE